MSESANIYAEKIKAKEQDAAVNDTKLIDEERFKKEYGQKEFELKTVIDGDQNLTPEDKTALWASTQEAAGKNFGILSGELERLATDSKEALRGAIEALNTRAFALLVKIKTTISAGQGKSIETGKLVEGIRKDNFARNLSKLEMKLKHLTSLHQGLEEARAEGGLLEAICGRMEAMYEKEIEKTTKQVLEEYVALAAYTRIVYPEGQRKMGQIKDKMDFWVNLQHPGFAGQFLSLAYDQVTTKQGLAESWEFLKAYSVGVVKGVVSMLDPRTYIALAEMIGEASASLIFCDDNWEKFQAMIGQMGDAWDKADQNGKAEMLGTFMGTLVGTKGLGMVTKAAKVSMLAKVKGTTLGMTMGETGGAVLRTVSRGTEAVAGVTRTAKAARAARALAASTAEAVKAWTPVAKEAVGELKTAEGTVARGRRLLAEGKIAEFEGGPAALEQAESRVAALRGKVKELTGMEPEAALAAEGAATPAPSLVAKVKTVPETVLTAGKKLSESARKLAEL
ncbi:MAG: hypothetical protein WCX95_04255, partial [Candidatus Gracilibacteria bacterium]